MGFWSGEIDLSWQLKTVRFNRSGMEDNVSLLAIDRLVEARHFLFVAERKQRWHAIAAKTRAW